jgi:hypothetical protein
MKRRRAALVDCEAIICPQFGQMPNARYPSAANPASA